jgi:superoxide reductase
MTKLNEIYKCNVCGNIVEMVHASAGQLVCCGQPMQLMQENTVDASKEKHVPVIERTPKCITVKVGSVAHPMEEKHYIEWIELVMEESDDNGSSGKKKQEIVRKHLKPGDKPEASFCCATNRKFTAREYCNLHGLWKS